MYRASPWSRPDTDIEPRALERMRKIGEGKEYTEIMTGEEWWCEGHTDAGQMWTPWKYSYP